MPAFSDDIFFATIPELNAKLKAGEFSAVELAKAFLDRLSQWGPRYNALALLLEKQALRAAKDVDGDLKRGRYRGPLQGIPYGAKDLLGVAGEPAVWGAKPFAGQISKESATVIEKLAGTGAVLVGKLAMVELAGGGGYRYASASVTGPGLNPWDPSRWSGGSSSGSGSAVAAGLVLFAIGSETWGSIVVPSAFCGITGLRPTYGLVSRHGAMALSWTMDKLGPMCRSAEDCAIVLHAISGGDSDDPSSAGKSFHYTPQFARKLTDLRIGFAQADFRESAAPETRGAYQRALQVIQGMNIEMEEVELPDLPYEAVAETVIGAEGSVAFETLIRSGRLEELSDPWQIAGLKAGLEIPARDYLKAMRIRTLVQQAMRDLFRKVDILIGPSTMEPAPGIRDRLDEEPPDAAPRHRGLRSLGAAGNLAGLPALSLPCGFAGNLPVGLQLVGRPFTENNLIAAGKEFQARTDWHRRRPPLPT